MIPGNYREHSSVSLSRQINLHKDGLICYTKVPNVIPTD